MEASRSLVRSARQRSPRRRRAGGSRVQAHPVGHRRRHRELSIRLEGDCCEGPKVTACAHATAWCVRARELADSQWRSCSFEFRRGTTP